MSVLGPSETSSRVDPIGSPTSDHDQFTNTGDVRTPQNMSDTPSPSHGRESFPLSRNVPPIAPVEMRVHFDEFAAQLRLHRHGEHKRRMLEHRRTHLQKAVALSGRLRRLTSWLHDGLVEISKFTNTADFVRVHEHLLNLTDVCFSRWSTDIRASDAVSSGAPSNTTTGDFLAKLSQSSQNDCLEFIRNVRSNPRFLIERFKAVSSAQLVALSTAPQYHDLGTYITSFSGSRGRVSQRKRIQSYARNLEEYATTFERKNPMSFLLHNCFAASSPSENHLRLQTWSTICAEMYVEQGDAFLAFLHQILWEFSGTSSWRARDRLELFLMDTLQRGAFLLEPIGDIRKGSLDSYIADTLDGGQAREFFDGAVRELFEILSLQDGGFPQGVLELLRAIVAKLPDEATQGRFRGYAVFDWLLQRFLRNAIEFPENREMLLQFHISDSARSTILLGLWQRACRKAEEIISVEDIVGPDAKLQDEVNSIINQLYAEDLMSDTPAKSPYMLDCISLCASDLIHTLEAMSQQYKNAASHFEPFMQYTATAFHSSYSRARPKLDKLRRELQLLFEPGHSSVASHATSEEWLLIPLIDGNPAAPPSIPPTTKPTTVSLLDKFPASNPVQTAAIRLALDDKYDLLNPSSPVSERRSSLQDLMIMRERQARSSADTVDANFWASALDYYDENYPLAFTSHAESRMLRPLVTYLQHQAKSDDRLLEARVAELEQEFQAAKESLVKAGKRMEHLKLKMWYVTSVVVSSAYENAQNITKALAYMWLPTPPAPAQAYSVSSGSRDRPGTSTSTASSLFEQPRLDTMKILKAPKEHGGPKKLADEQIELTKRWLERNEIDNFCKGEERIHRFCMEIEMATQKLVAESAVESPDLWSSDLWTKERNLFESSPVAASGIPFSTRPSSVISDAPSSTPWGRPAYSSALSSRSLDADNASSPGARGLAAGYGSSWMPHSGSEGDLQPTSVLPSRSLTATSAESIWSSSSPFSSQARSQTSASLAPSIWSHSSAAHPSRSQTSASLSSRPPSIYSEIPQLKPFETGMAKTCFLETIREGLTVLLLSDLGNPVWSLGSETDAWLESHRRNSHVSRRLSRRQQLSQLLSSRSAVPMPAVGTGHAQHQRRSWSTDDTHTAKEDSGKLDAVPRPDQHALYDLDDVLKKVSRQVDPNAKLRAIHEFRQLAVLCLERQTVVQVPTRSTGRRQSLEPGVSGSRLRSSPVNSTVSAKVRSEKDIRDYIRNVLHALEPKTLFRDLQYIAAFTSLDALNQTEQGKAFVQIGLAALSSKDEVCRAMVELADRIVARDGIKRRASAEDAEYALNKARDYWIIAAKEGNAVAQRELASLYLAHPEISVPPTVTAPLSVAGEIFTNEMMWRGNDNDVNRQALCLALHWMQLAAAAGDTIARQKLEERKGQATK
jgi:hypothetical protein